MAPLALVQSNKWEVASGYCKSPMGVMQRPELSHGAKLLYILILDQAKEKGWVERSQRWLAFHIGEKRTATVRQYTAELVEYGLIQVTSGKDPGKWNTFRLLEHVWLHKKEGWPESVYPGGRNPSTWVAGFRPQIQSRETRTENSDQNTCDPLRGSLAGDDPSHVRDVHVPDEVHSQGEDAVQLKDYAAVAAAKARAEAQAKPETPPEQDMVEEVTVQDKDEARMTHIQAVEQEAASKSKKSITKKLNKKAKKEWGRENPTLGQKIEYLHTKHKVPESMKPAAHKLGDLWHDEFRAKFPGVDQPRIWGPKEMLCSVELILNYDFDKVAEAIKYFLRNWETLQPRIWKGKVVTPTIGVLKGVHDSIFPEAGVAGPALRAIKQYDEWRDKNPTEFHAPADLEQAYTQAKAKLAALGLKL